MNILVVGSGGREHALVWKLRQSPLAKNLYCAPGNAGIAALAECVDIGVNDFARLIAFVKEKQVDFTVVGPEDPLSRGLVDAFESEGLRAFGPSAAAAELEASKAFAKRIMTEQGIPTASYHEFTDFEAALAFVRSHGAPVVIKADGLAAGKGVTVAHDLATAETSLQAMMQDKVFGSAGGKVVVEECLVGEEASILAFSDGRTVVPMVPSQDHKPVFDDDQGPNTGGMGAYAPAPVVTSELLDQITDTILKPCIRGMAEAGRLYKGILYAGLMVTADGPKVIEFNCRFGDPETQVVLPLLESDLIPLLEACCDGTLHEHRPRWRNGACVSVVMASGGYPGAYAKDKVISGLHLAEEEGAMVFHAGTRRVDGAIVTAGGRVLNVTATGDSVPSAIENAYRAVGHIHFEGAHYRRDIGQKALKRPVG